MTAVAVPVSTDQMRAVRSFGSEEELTIRVPSGEISGEMHSGFPKSSALGIRGGKPAKTCKFQSVNNDKIIAMPTTSRVAVCEFIAT